MEMSRNPPGRTGRKPGGGNWEEVGGLNLCEENMEVKCFMGTILAQ
jgi:hypothetical protein